MKIGKVSENIIKRSVLKNIDNSNSAAAGSVCAIFTGYIADESSAECAVHAIIRAYNNAAVAGLSGSRVALTISMPEKMREIKLKDMMKCAGEYAKINNIQIVDGHTETVIGLVKPIVTATLIADRYLDDSKPGERGTNRLNPKDLKPGQSIVMTKWMAMSGSARIAREHMEELKTRYPSFLLEDAVALEQFYSVVPEAAVAIKTGAVCMNDCSDGGIFAALWQLGDMGGVGLEVDLKSIPVRQESIEVCEFFDINPYRLRSDGSMLIVTDTPDELIESLASEEILGTVIGHISDNNDRVIVSGEDRRFLEEPRQDEGVML